VEGPVEGAGFPGQWEAQPGGAGLSHDHGCVHADAAEKDDALSAVSELEVRKWLDEQGAGAEVGGYWGDSIVTSHARLHGVRRNGLGAGPGGVFASPICFVFYARYSLLSFSSVISLVRITSSCDRPGPRAEGSLQCAATARTADRKRTVHNLAMI